MFRWYKQAVLCYAYLADIKCDGGIPELVPPPDIAPSRWFTRGWTLQELIAPENLIFYDKYWRLIGGKSELCETISNITGIDSAILVGKRKLASISIAQRMFWASARETTRIEDMAYCLLGVFDANMPLLYGEGDKAFTRLQEVIMSQSEDHSLFAWKAPRPYRYYGAERDTSGLLASSPANFAAARNITPMKIADLASPYSMTNRGLQIRLPQLPVNAISGNLTTLLACIDKDHPLTLLAIQLRPIGRERDKFCRVNYHELSYVPTREMHQALINTIFVKEEISGQDSEDLTMQYWTTLRTLPTFVVCDSEREPCELHSVFPVDLWSEELRGLSKSPDTKAGALFVQGLSSFVLVLGIANSELWCNLLPLRKNETIEDVVKRSEDQYFGTCNNGSVRVQITTQWTLGLKNFVIDITPL